MAANAHVHALWQRKIDDQHASGLSITAWCVQHDISPQTFYYWRKQLRASPPVPSSPQWLAVAPAESPGATLTLRIDRITIKVPVGFDPRLLAEVLTVLEGR